MAIKRFGLTIKVFDPTEERGYKVVNGGVVCAQNPIQAREIINELNQSHKMISTVFIPDKNGGKGKWEPLEHEY